METCETTRKIVVMCMNGVEEEQKLARWWSDGWEAMVSLANRDGTVIIVRTIESVVPCSPTNIASNS